MMKKVLVILFLCIFFLQVVSAIDTEIKIKTTQFTGVDLTILDPGADFRAYKVYKGTSDFYGDLTLIHSGEESFFDLMVVLKKSGAVIYKEQFRNVYTAGSVVILEVVPEGSEILETPEDLNSTNIPLTNTTLINSTEELNGSVTLNETNITIEQESINKSGFLGLSIFSGKGFFSLKTLYYTLGFLVLLAIIFFVFRFMKTKRPQKIKVTKLSEMKSPEVEKKDSVEESSVDKIIKEAEEKIKKAQEEISGLKKNNRIKELKEELKELSKE